MAKPKPAPLSAGTAIGSYTVERVVATGGTSIVYLGHTAEGQAVLIKEYLPAAVLHRTPGERLPLVRPGALPRLRRGVQAFLDGARHLARLQQPSLATVLDCVQAHETVYLVLRYLEGRTLQDFIVAARGRRDGLCLSESSTISVGLDLLAALQVVHGAGLLHLDVKPSNVLITLAGRLVLLDFDAAMPMPGAVTLPDGANGPRQIPADAQAHPLAHAPAHTLAHTPAHTPGFSAPETLANPLSHGPWTDIYAVGACLYACMVGHPPAHCLDRAADDPVPAVLNGLRGRYGGALLDLVQQALSLPLGQRLQSSAEMMRALEGAAQSWH